MSDYAAEFWQTTERYHDLAREFERNIEVTHPDRITSDGQCSAGDIMRWCRWCRTSVVYREYRGPRPTAL